MPLTMVVELWCLLAAIVLGIVHVSADSFSFKAQAGNDYTLGPRDEPIERKAMAGRLHRAAHNYTENLVLFIAAVVLLRATDTSTTLSHWATCTWVIARAAYLPGYASGIRWVRTIFWQIAMIGLILMLIAPFV